MTCLVVVPAADLLVPKLKRGEPRDHARCLGEARGFRYRNTVETTIHNDDTAVCGERIPITTTRAFEYGRRFWHDPQMRARLLAHWLDERILTGSGSSNNAH
jgi:hypothetical protein